MNLPEEREKLEAQIEALTNQIASDTIALSVVKSKLKKLDKAIKQAEEALK